MEELLIERNESCVYVQYRDVLRERNEFVQVVYTHWHYGGFWGYIITRALQLLSVGLVLLLLALLALFVDWSALMNVTELTDAVHWSGRHNSLTIVLFSMALFAWLAWLVKEAMCAYTVWRVHCVLLHIFPEDLKDTKGWTEIVDDVSHFLHMQPQEFTTRLLRQKHFMTALVRSDHLMLEWGRVRVNMLSYPLVWALHVSFLPLLDDPPCVESNSKSSVFSKRALLLGVLGLVLSPCVLVVVVVYYICRYGEHLRHQPGWVSSRHWSLYATLYLRHPEDTNHALRERLDAVAPMAEKYCQSKHSTIVAAALQFAAFCFSMGTVLILALALFDDDVLVRQTFFGRALLWWLGIMASGVGLCRVLQRNTPEVHQPVLLLQDIASQLRMGSGQELLRVHFSTFYEYRAIGFAWELASVVLAPLFLLFVVRGRAEAMLSFLHNRCEYVEGIGCVKAFRV